MRREKPAKMADKALLDELVRQLKLCIGVSDKAMQLGTDTRTLWKREAYQECLNFIKARRKHRQRKGAT